MTNKSNPVFLERDRYRLRRWADAAKLLPLLGLVLWLLPTFWSSSGSDLDSILYIFGVWGLLIALVSLVSRRVMRDPPDETKTSESDSAQPDET